MLPLVKVLASTASLVLPIGYAMYEAKSKKTAFISDRLYCGYMNSEFTDEQVKELCSEFKIPYPPKPCAFFSTKTNEIPL